MTGGTKLEKIKQNPIVKKLGFNRIILFCILVLLYVAFSVAIPGFAGMARIMSILNYVYFLGFLALGVTFVIATGGIDFSIGPVMFCCALMAGYTLNTYKAPVIVAIIMSVVIGFCFGVFNGWLVSFVGVPPFIVSMASMNIAKGLGSVFTKTQSVSWPQVNDPDGRGWFRSLVKVGDVPTGLIIFAVFVIILFIIMNNTKPGRYILSLGSNKEAVRLSGVNVRKWQMLAYVICGTAGSRRHLQQRGYRILRYGRYIHGRRSCIHRRYRDRRVCYFSSAGRHHGTPYDQGSADDHHRSDRYRVRLC